MDTFGEWLRWQREQRHLTREQFSEQVGCSVALLRKIEAGERRPSVQIAGLIANCLGIPLTKRETFVRVARGELNLERLPAAFQPAPASTYYSSNLPVLPTPLIGRRREVAELTQLLGDPHCRLLTLVGPGGIGKTRLAIETASQVQQAFTGGVYLAPLASIDTARFIVPVIADALGFTFENASQADPKTQLFNYLKGKQILLLIDNLEHLLVGPGIEVLAELLEHAPQVKLLATSREALGFAGEWVYEVHGLPVPDGLNTQGSGQETSVELFLQRARRAHVGFKMMPNDYPSILHICQLVDGMPLGIELAAAWVRTLSCAEIAAEIKRGLDFLSISTRELPPRHCSMRSVFDQSWKLLMQEEQDILLRLSIFRGGFQREAAEKAAGATLPLLAALVTKSLIRRSGAGRYDLHELIRQFAIEQFAGLPEEQAAAQARHGRYYLAFFGQAIERLQGSAQRQTLAELAVEMDNFRLAWDWALEQGEFVLIEEALRTFTMFYDMRGWFQEGIDDLTPATAALEAVCREPVPGRIEQLTLGHLLVCQGLFSFRLARHDQAQAMLQRSLEILRPLNEPRVLVEALTFLGFVVGLTDDYARSVELFSEGLEIAAAIGDRWFAALCRMCLADQLGFVLGKATPDETFEQMRLAVEDWRAIGDPRFTAIGLNSFSLSALTLGRYSEARSALEESMVLSASVGDRWGLGFAYRGLGSIAQVQGDHLQAVDMFRKSLDTLTELGARQDVARLQAEMGRSYFALGEDAEADRTWAEALRGAIETGGMFIALESLVGIARLQAKGGAPERAIEWLWIALEHPACTQETRNRAVQWRSEIETQLTSQQIEAARARARAKTFYQVVEEILFHSGNGPSTSIL